MEDETYPTPDEEATEPVEIEDEEEIVEEEDEDDDSDPAFRPDPDVYGTGGDRVSEYFHLRDSMKAFRREIKEAKEEHVDYEELQKLNEKVKEIRTKMRSTPRIAELEEKVGELKDRLDLITDILKQQLIESPSGEIVKNGKKLKLVQVMKEGKESDK